jgi:hypothetical protein
VEIHVFPDTFHGFDLPGKVSAHFTSGGHIQEYNPIARAKSEEIIDTFVRSLDTILAAKRKAAEKTRHALTGKTLRLQLPNGRTVFQYLGPDGQAPAAVAGGRRFDKLRWRVNEEGELCRTSIRDGREACVPITLEHETMVFDRPDGGGTQSAALLTGNRLPKQEPGASAPGFGPPGMTGRPVGEGQGGPAAGPMSGMGNPGLPPAPRAIATRLIGRFDSNGDGRISRSEFRSGRIPFEELDANKDGYATAGEIEKAIQARRGGRRALAGPRNGGPEGMGQGGR